MSIKSSPWIVRRAPRDNASLRLFCFPHAGAGSVIFKDWYADFGPNVDVCAIEPPGRLARRRDPMIRSLPEFVAALEPELEPYLDVPFVLFGYSLGAAMAFESARALRRRRNLEPKHLIVAAARAPQLPRRLTAISQEPEPAFVRELERRYGPIEPVIKSDPEMLTLITEIMRVDLCMLENYQYQAEPSFDCPVLAIGGTEDASLAPGELEGWSAHTSNAFRAQRLPGGHFFLRTAGKELRDLVRAQIQPANPISAYATT